MSTNIEWVCNSDGTKGKTWNPVTGCTKISIGCQNCYAERTARRLAGRYGYPEAPHHFDVTLHEDRIYEPLDWKKPRRVFVCSTGDLFHEDVPSARADDFLVSVFAVMGMAHWHTFQILTKRARRMRDFMKTFQAFQNGCVSPNIWLGGSASTQPELDEIAPILLDTPAAVRFLSLEPLLGPVDLSNWLTCWVCMGTGEGIGGVECPICGGTGSDTRLSWVIVGCESGPHRRPCNIDWIRDVRDQCVMAGVPFSLKQREIDGKLVKMPELDGQVWDQMPERRG